MKINLSKLIPIFIIVPIIELMLLIEVGKLLGLLGTVALVLITGIVGVALAKFEGLRVFADAQSNLLQGQLPTDHVIAGVLILVAGLLLITPGILTDIVGFLLLFSWSRRVVVSKIKEKYMKKRNRSNVIEGELTNK